MVRLWVWSFLRHNSFPSQYLWNSWNKLTIPKIQLWDRHRITIIDIPFKKEKMEGKRNHQSQAILTLVDKQHYFSSSGINTLVFGSTLWIYSSTFKVILTFPWMVLFSELSFNSLCSACRILGVWQPSLIHSLTVSFSQNWFSLYKILKNFVGHTYIFWDLFH